VGKNVFIIFNTVLFSCLLLSTLAIAQDSLELESEISTDPAPVETPTDPAIEVDSPPKPQPQSHLVPKKLPVRKKKEKKYQTYYTLTPREDKFDFYFSYQSNSQSVSDATQSIDTKHTSNTLKGYYGLTANQALGIEYAMPEASVTYKSQSASAKGSPQATIVYKGNVSFETDTMYFLAGYSKNLDDNSVNLDKTIYVSYTPPTTILAEIGWIHPTQDNYYGIIFSNPIYSTGSYTRTILDESGTVDISAGSAPKLLGFFEYRDETHFNMSLGYSNVTPGKESSSMAGFSPRTDFKTEVIELAASFRIPIYSSTRYFFLPELRYDKMKYLDLPAKVEAPNLSQWGFTLSIRFLL